MLQISEERLSELMAQAVKRALGDHPCRFQLEPREVDHVMGMLTDIGDGDLRRGVEIVRVNHGWLMERLKKDEEYEANHACVTWVRGIIRGVGGKLASFFVWGCIIVTAVGLVIFFGTKAAPIVKGLLNSN